MLLKRLDLPPHVATLVPLLGKLYTHGIRTTEQVILIKKETLLSLIQTKSDSTNDNSASRLSAALDILISTVLSRVPVQNGHAIAEKLDKKVKPKYPDGIFGIAGLDDLLGTPNCILQLCGSRGCGKSLLALHATLRLLGADPTATARWVDTEGAFNASRAQAVLTVLGLEESVLDRLTVSNLFRLEPELFDVLDQVRSEQNTKVLVIDNIAALFRDALMGATAQGHSAMVIAMNEIAELTYSKELMTIVTNSPASSVPSNPLSAFSSTTIKPSLGVSFSFEVDVEIVLQDTGRVFGFSDQAERERASSAPGLRILVEVLKSKVSPSGTWTVFETDGTALLDVLPPPLDDEATVARSAGLATGRPTHGPLHAVLGPAT